MIAQSLAAPSSVFLSNVFIRRDSLLKHRKAISELTNMIGP